ncbi:MAG: Imm44 family immunity protein [Bacillota bacterium]|jgi:hypothetical protein
MILWMSGEVMEDVGESSRLASNEIEEYINEHLQSIDYGPEVEKWAYIAIILPAKDEFLTEIYKYHKRRKVAEFRLKVDHDKFIKANQLEQRKMLCESLLRSITLFPQIKIKNFDYKRLETDFARIAKEKGWL